MQTTAFYRPYELRLTEKREGRMACANVTQKELVAASVEGFSFEQHKKRRSFLDSVFLKSPYIHHASSGTVIILMRSEDVSHGSAEFTHM